MQMPQNASRPHKLNIMSNTERQPLLESESQQNDLQIISHGDIPVYPDSLPGPGYGKSLTWWSCYIIVVSRVIGSGIFSTPGAIATSTGSVGLTILVWLFGTILSACGLAVSMEYGCMLPRSGGDKVIPYFRTTSRPQAVNTIFLNRYI